jgi:hypothetical protein
MVSQDVDQIVDQKITLIDKSSRFNVSYSKKIVSLHRNLYFIEKNGKEHFATKRTGNRNGFSMIGYTQMDLGIAKYHFEVGAGTDNI